MAVSDGRRSAEGRSVIVYDGDCIFCQNYTRLLRLRKSIGDVELLDARSDDPRIRQFWTKGYDLNQGMLFLHQGQVYHGADAIHVLATLSSGSSFFNRLNATMFSSARLARIAYPFLKFGRRITLWARGRELLRQQDMPGGPGADSSRSTTAR
jgi:predicted DCC family thiol-disulfide oxidoreductase YuxK